MAALTYEMLPAMGVLWLTNAPLAKSEKNRWDDQAELLLFPERLPGREQHPELAEEAQSKLQSYWEGWSAKNPVLAYAERFLDARIAFDIQGDYRSCVVQCQTALEVLFDGLILLMYWEEGVSPENAAQEVFGISLHHRVRKLIPPRLGGDWNTRGSGVTGTWAQSLVPLRNRVVHGGLSPTRDQAIEALSTVREIDDFFRSRLVASRLRYKRVCFIVVGRPGLESLGFWNGQMKQFIDEQAGLEPNWKSSFHHWQNEVFLAKERLA